MSACCRLCSASLRAPLASHWCTILTVMFACCTAWLSLSRNIMANQALTFHNWCDWQLQLALRTVEAKLLGTDSHFLRKLLIFLAKVSEVVKGTLYTSSGHSKLGRMACWCTSGHDSDFQPLPVGSKDTRGEVHLEMPKLVPQKLLNRLGEAFGRPWVCAWMP